MVKGTELWDDSVLINAFDAAMASYKEMHSECLNGHVLGNENDENSEKEADIVLIDVVKCERQTEFEATNLDSDNMKETCALSRTGGTPAYVPSTQENDVSNFSTPEFNPLISNHPSVNLKIVDDSDHQNSNQDELLKQYHELEQRKEKILQQLWQANYWNYQTPIQCSTSQHQQVPIITGYELSQKTSCFCCACQCLAAITNSMSNCPMAGSLFAGYACCPQQHSYCSSARVQQEVGGAHCYTDGGKCSTETSVSLNSVNHFVHGGDGTVEAGVMPGDMVRDTAKVDLSRACNLGKGKKNDGEDYLSSGGQKTDLTSVMNAWYWAGYHTGRYLLEQERPSQLSNNTTGNEQRDTSEE